MLAVRQARRRTLSRPFIEFDGTSRRSSSAVVYNFFDVSEIADETARIGELDFGDRVCLPIAE